ncbi:hypothetical protein HDU93_002778 [Gonapodya sp. JEL0774]|nr:hypothetical protein HDU93_002778 [Gonapodya sp. JEL0774]
MPVDMHANDVTEIANAERTVSRPGPRKGWLESLYSKVLRIDDLRANRGTSTFSKSFISDRTTHELVEAALRRLESYFEELPTTASEIDHLKNSVSALSPKEGHSKVLSYDEDLSLDVMRSPSPSLTSCVSDTKSNVELYNRVLSNPPRELPLIEHASQSIEQNDVQVEGSFGIFPDMSLHNPSGYYLMGKERTAIVDALAGAWEMNVSPFAMHLDEQTDNGPMPSVEVANLFVVRSFAYLLTHRTLSHAAGQVDFGSLTKLVRKTHDVRHLFLWTTNAASVISQAECQRFGDFFFYRCLNMLHRILDSPGARRLDMVECVLYLARYGHLTAPDSVQPLISVAVTMARELGLFKDSSQIIGDGVYDQDFLEYEEARRRTAWSVYLADRQCALINHTLPLMKESEMSVKIPALQPEWERYIGTSPHTYFTINVDTIQLYQIVSQFFEHRTASIQCGVNPSDPAALSKYSFFQELLTTWHVKMLADVEPNLRNAIYRRTLLLFHFIALIVSSPTTIKDMPLVWVSSTAFVAAVNNAKQIAELLRIPDAIITNCGCLEMTAVYVSAIVHVARVLMGSCAEGALRDLNTHIHHLEYNADYWTRVPAYLRELKLLRNTALWKLGISPLA